MNDDTNTSSAPELQEPVKRPTLIEQLIAIADSLGGDEDDIIWKAVDALTANEARQTELELDRRVCKEYYEELLSKSRAESAKIFMFMYGRATPNAIYKAICDGSAPAYIVKLD